MVTVFVFQHTMVTVFVFQHKVDAVVHFASLKVVWLIVFVFWHSVSCFVFQHKMDVVIVIHFAGLT